MHGERQVVDRWHERRAPSYAGRACVHLLPSGKVMPGEPKVSHLPMSMPTSPFVLGEKSIEMDSPSSDTLP